MACRVPSHNCNGSQVHIHSKSILYISNRTAAWPATKLFRFFYFCVSFNNLFAFLFSAFNCKMCNHLNSASFFLVVIYYILRRGTEIACFPLLEKYHLFRSNSLRVSAVCSLNQVNIEICSIIFIVVSQRQQQRNNGDVKQIIRSAGI